MEVQEIFNCTDKASNSRDSFGTKDNLSYMLKPRIMKPLLLMLAYMVLQSLSGLETVSYYCLMLFRGRWN